jgi:hypothetical protein
VRHQRHQGTLGKVQDFVTKEREGT